MKKSAFALSAVLSLAAMPAASGPYTDLYVFGDSLVDAGNISVLTGGAVPSAALGYFNGRFTNGPDYTDLLSRALFYNFTTASLAGGDNFAFGGARVANNSVFSGASFDTIPDLGAQVASYLARSGGVADPNALYAITATGNDIFAIQAGRINGMSEADYIELVTDTFAANIIALDAAGARNILVTGVPNLGVAAAVALETSLLARLATLSLEAELFHFSFFDFFSTILTDPDSLGLPVQDLSVRCMDVRPVIDGRVDCTGIFSFDGTHFSGEVHAALYREIGRLVGVPEPAALALFGLGLCALGLRRRQRLPV